MEHEEELKCFNYEQENKKLQLIFVSKSEKKIANSTNISGVSIMCQAPGYSSEQHKQNLHLHGTSGRKMHQENKNDKSPIIDTIWVPGEGEPLTCSCWAVLNLLEVVLF